MAKYIWQTKRYKLENMFVLPENPSLDEMYKIEIFRELNKKYTSYQLEDLLKSKGIL